MVYTEDDFSEQVFSNEISQLAPENLTKDVTQNKISKTISDVVCGSVIVLCFKHACFFVFSCFNVDLIRLCCGGNAR